MNEKKVREIVARARALEAEIAEAAGGEVPPHLAEALRVAREDAAKAAGLAESALTEASGAARANVAADRFVQANAQLSAIMQALGEPRDQPAGKLPLADRAGAVSERRAVGDRVASPALTPETPFHFPGGLVLNVVVPRGFYSEPWWRDVGLRAAAGTVVSVQVGQLALDFYDKVLAGREGRPQVEDWASGVESGVGRVQRWWEYLDPEDVLGWVL